MIDVKEMAKFFDEKFQLDEDTDYEFELCAFYVECKKLKHTPVLWLGDIGLPEWEFYNGYIWGVQPRNGNTSIIIDPKLNVRFSESHSNMYRYKREAFEKKIDEMRKEDKR